MAHQCSQTFENCLNTNTPLKSLWGNPCNGLYGKALPERETFFNFWEYEGVGIHKLRYTVHVYIGNSWEISFLDILVM